MSNELWKMHEAYVQRTPPEIFITDATAYAGVLVRDVVRKIGIRTQKVYMTSRAMKHLYDKKPAEEFDFVLDHVSLMLENPDALYIDKSDKRGGFCLSKKL
jgi:hypothetical protein